METTERRPEDAPADENMRVVITAMGEPIHLTVTLNAKGKIQYEISVHGDVSTAILEEIDRLEQGVHERYRGKLAGDSDE